MDSWKEDIEILRAEGRHGGKRRAVVCPCGARTSENRLKGGECRETEGDELLVKAAKWKAKKRRGGHTYVCTKAAVESTMPNHGHLLHI